MRYRTTIKLVLSIPFIAFFIFRILIVGSFILHDSMTWAVVFNGFHMIILFSDTYAKSSKSLTVAAFALAAIVMVEGLDVCFNEKSLTMRYAEMIDTLLQAICGISGAPQPQRVIILDIIAWILTSALMYFHIIELKHEEFMKLFDFKTTGPSIIFSEKLTEDIDGYFEDLAGLHMDYYEVTSLDNNCF